MVETLCDGVKLGCDMSVGGDSSSVFAALLVPASGAFATLLFLFGIESACAAPSDPCVSVEEPWGVTWLSVSLRLSSCALLKYLAICSFD